jgi:protein SCO1/2
VSYLAIGGISDIQNSSAAATLFQCSWIEGGRTFNLVFGAVTAAVCLAIAIPILWWMLPKHRVWLFSPAVDRKQWIQLGYGVFCMAMAFTDALCRFIPHGPLPWVHPALFLTTLLIAFGLGPRVIFLDFAARSRARQQLLAANEAPRGSGGISPRLRSAGLAVLLLLVVAFPVTAIAHGLSNRVAEAPDFALTDQDGRPFVLSDQRGRPVVLFFGYTHCPDACPTTLAHLAKAAHAAGVPGDLRVAFITVDPARDSPAALKRYMRVFDPAFTGLTGSQKALDPVYTAYDTWRQPVPVEHGPDNYFVAHGTTIYYIGRDGSLKGLGNWDDEPAVIAHALKEYQ